MIGALNTASGTYNSSVRLRTLYFLWKNTDTTLHEQPSSASTVWEACWLPPA